MKITPVCGNSLFSIRYIEFFGNDGRLLDSYFELTTEPFKCVGIFNTLEQAQAELNRLTKWHNRQANSLEPLPNSLENQRAMTRTAAG